MSASSIRNGYATEPGSTVAGARKRASVSGSPDLTGPISTRFVKSAPGLKAPAGTEPGGNWTVLRSERAGTAPPPRSRAAASTETDGGAGGDRDWRPKYTAA